jgi:hypothetical protein
LGIRFIEERINSNKFLKDREGLAFSLFSKRCEQEKSLLEIKDRELLRREIEVCHLFKLFTRGNIILQKVSDLDTFIFK